MSASFHVFLTNRMEEIGLDQATLAKELGYRTLIHVGGWCRGNSLPKACSLWDLAVVLKADPVEVSAWWLCSKAPELERSLREDVINPLFIRTGRTPPVY